MKAVLSTTIFLFQNQRISSESKTMTWRRDEYCCHRNRGKVGEEETTLFFSFLKPWTQCVARNLKYDLGEVSSVHPVLHAPERMPPIFPLPLSSKSHPSHAFQKLAHTMAALWQIKVPTVVTAKSPFSSVQIAGQIFLAIFSYAQLRECCEDFSIATNSSTRWERRERERRGKKMRSSLASTLLRRPAHMHTILSAQPQKVPWLPFFGSAQAEVQAVLHSSSAQVVRSAFSLPNYPIQKLLQPTVPLRKKLPQKTHNPKNNNANPHAHNLTK